MTNFRALQSVFLVSSIALAVALTTSCKRKAPEASESHPPPKEISLTEARQGFKTQLIRKEHTDRHLPDPPEPMFDLIEYEAPLGKMAALLGADPQDGEKHPAIIWLVGGFANSISASPWNPGTPDNDQSAASFRKAGIITMYPSLRGGNKNPGHKECLLGEVDDVLAAAEHLASIPYVDPERIYLGGHSVGGTLALLCAESSDRFRAVFSLGPIDRPSNYGPDAIPYHGYAAKEDDLRSPVEWLHCINTPTFVFEGEDGNAESIAEFEKASDNPLLKTFVVRGADHFNIIRPISELAARKILGDDAAGKSQIEVSDTEVTACTSAILAPPRPAFPKGSPRASFVEFEFAIYYLPRPVSAVKGVEGDPVADLKRFITSDFPKLQYVDAIDRKSTARQVSADLIEVVDESYYPPDEETLTYSANGLDPNDKKNLQGSAQALRVKFRHPIDDCLPALRDANQLLLKLAEGCLLWDEETRQVFSVDFWHKERLGSWSGDLPLMGSHVTIHGYRDGDYLRAITLGMKKFGMPDVVIEQIVPSNYTSAGQLINDLCQSFVEGAEVGEDGHFNLELKKIRHAERRETQLSGLAENGTGVAELALKRAAWDLGDPLNVLMAIGFDRTDGVDMFAQQDAVLTGYYGGRDEVSAVKHNAEIEAASERARAKLPDLRKLFIAGLEPDEHLLFKAPFKIPGGGNEWMWVEVINWKDEKIRGVLQNQPRDVPSLQSGQQVTIDQDTIFDFIHRHPDGTTSGNETSELLKKDQGR